MDTLNTVEDLLHLSPIRFQEMTMSLYQALGCEVQQKRIAGRHHLYVEITGKEGKKSLAECRIGLQDVTKEDVDSFASLLKHEKASEGAIITLAGVSEKARAAIKKKNIYLYDGKDFLSLWKNLHLSETTPREKTGLEEKAVPMESPAESLAAGPMDASPELFQEEMRSDGQPADEGQTSFLDQIQAEAEKDIKSQHSRAEIHRLFGGKPQENPLPEVVQPVEAEAAPEPAPEIIPEWVPQAPETAFSAEEAAPLPEPPAIEPAMEWQPAFPEEEPAGSETQALGLEPPAEADLVEPQIPAPPGETPASAAPQSLELLFEPEPAAPAEENENVIHRLFGRDLEQDIPAASAELPADQQDEVDFSIFAIPGTKPAEPEAETAAAMQPSAQAETPLAEWTGEAPAVSEPSPQEPIEANLPLIPDQVYEEEEETLPEWLQASPAEPPVETPQAIAVVSPAGVEEPPASEETVAEEFPPMEPHSAGLEEPAIEPFIAEEPAQVHQRLDAIPPLEEPAGPAAPAEEIPSPSAEAGSPMEMPAEAQAPAEEASSTVTTSPAEEPAELPTAAAPIQPVETISALDESPEVTPPAESPAAINEAGPVETIPTVETPIEPAPAAPEPEPLPKISEPAFVVLPPALKTASSRQGPDPENPEFSQAIERLEAGSACLFVTGRPGTGKKALLDYILEHSDKNIVVLASTPSVSMDIQAQTIRSFFHFPDRLLTKEDIQQAGDLSQQQLYQRIDLLVIDEVCAVNANMMDGMDGFLRLNGRQPDAAFGGVQVLLLGDLFQMVSSRLGDEITSPAGENYRSPFFFDAQVFQQMPIELLELQKDYARHDETLKTLLNSLRVNALDEDQFTLLNSRYAPHFIPAEASACITLTSNESQAAHFNKEQLKQLRAPECLHIAEIEGEFNESAYPAEKELILRRGAQVVFLKDDPSNRWIRGTLGKVTSVSESTIQVEIETDGLPFTFRVERETWQNVRYKADPADGKIEKELVGEFTQYPLCQGWAMAVQKSHGCRFDRVLIDLSSEEGEYGQLYTALCSCKKLEGIVLKNKVSQKYKANAGNRIQEVARLFFP